MSLYLLIGLNGDTRKMKQRYADIDGELLPLLPENKKCMERMKEKIPKAGKGLEAQIRDLSKASRRIGRACKSRRI